MSPDPDPLAIAFANTLSSPGRDHIATLGEFRDWAQAWPILTAFLPQLTASAVPGLRAQREATQMVLHHLADHTPPPQESFDRATRSGLRAAPFPLFPAASGAAPGRGDALGSIAHLLSRAVVDLVLDPHAGDLRRCDGAQCRRVFLARREARRWCDGRICGNRARVAAYARSRRDDPGN